MIISITINSHAQCTLRAYSSIHGMSAMFFPRIKQHNEQKIQIQEDPFKPLVSIDLIIFKLNKPQQHAWSRAIMWGLIKKNEKKVKEVFIHRSRLTKIQSQHTPERRKSQSAQRTLDYLSCLGMSLPCQLQWRTINFYKPQTERTDKKQKMKTEYSIVAQ